MTRSSNKKTLDCSGCQQPQPVGAEAIRVLCGFCVLLGKSFPRDVQIALSLGQEPTTI
jgi:hypothetical protein